MSWIDADIDSTVVVVRAIYFAATATLTGAIVFRTLIAGPSLRPQGETSKIICSRIRMVAWISLPIVVTSGAIWLLLLTESLSDESFRESVMSGALRDVLIGTQFGIVMQVRLAVAIVLVIGLWFDRSRWGTWFALAAALGLTASIAWTGHAASTPHGLGYLHLASDALHVCAASAWIGGLLPLALLLQAGKRDHPLAWPLLEFVAATRFSVLGIVCVATLIASGGINSWILVGSLSGLLLTTYGRILIAKLVVFAMVLAFAAVNRFYLTPELASPPGSGAQSEAIRRLTRNTIVEIALGGLIFAIVGLLGTLHPAAHLMH